jgi:DNA-binding NarL/FixJ family response regulator
LGLAYGALVEAIHVSPRQEEVLGLIAAGLTDKEIASRLGLRQRTIRTHLERMYARHGIHNRAGAVSMWLRSQVAAARPPTPAG